MLGDQELLTVIEKFSEAATDSEQWSQALRQLAALTRSSHAQLIGIGGPDTIQFNIISDLPPSLTEEFIQIDGSNPLVNPRIAASNSAEAMELVTDRHIGAARSLIRSDDYLDFASKHDFPFGCQMAMQKDEEGVIGLALLRSHKEGSTPQEQLKRFQTVAPFVHMATKVQTQLQGQGPLLLAEAFEAMSLSAFVCDAEGRILANTPSAETLFSDGWLLKQLGHLTGGDGVNASLLRRAISRCGRRGLVGLPRCESVVLRAPLKPEPLVLDVTSIAEPSRNIFQRRRVLVLARRSRYSGHNRIAILRACFGLTQAEAGIAVAILGGLDRQSISRSRGVSAGTVQTQMKSIFQKVHVRRESELVAVLSRVLET